MTRPFLWLLFKQSAIMYRSTKQAFFHIHVNCKFKTFWKWHQRNFVTFCRKCAYELRVFVGILLWPNLTAFTTEVKSVQLQHKLWTCEVSCVYWLLHLMENSYQWLPVLICSNIPFFEKIKTSNIVKNII